jgi:predicted Abi (CAAX) family protease
MAPRSLLRADAGLPTLANPESAYRYARREVWRSVVSSPGSVDGRHMAPWNAGDVALLLHTYGGIGGKAREKDAAGPVYFGHFAYGIAEVVDDPLAGEPRFAITYHQVYTQNPDGLIAGALDWSRYMGDRQYGWGGIRPVCEALVRHDGFTTPFQIDGGGSASALDTLVLHLEAMTARYRIGDGTGGTFVGPANNCAQDSNRALFATLEDVQRFVREHPAFDAWSRSSPGDYGRYRALASLASDLRKKLQPWGSPRPDWTGNQYTVGSTMEDAPMESLARGLGSWRCILPRLAFDTIAGTFLHHGAGATVWGMSYLGGERSDVAPVVPLTL